MQDVIIRDAVGADAEQMRAVAIQSWLDTYTNPDLGIDEDVLLGMLNPTPERLERDRAALAEGNSAQRAAWVAVVGDRVVGLCTPHHDTERRQRLGALYVDRAWCGRGIGQALLAKALGWRDPARPLLLEVATYTGVPSGSTNATASCGCRARRCMARSQSSGWSTAPPRPDGAVLAAPPLLGRGRSRGGRPVRRGLALFCRSPVLGWGTW